VKDAGKMDIVLFVFISWLLAKLLIVSPILLPAVAFYCLRRSGVGKASSALIAVVPVFLFIAWAVSGLSDLRDICQSTQPLHNTSEKLGSIDALLIADGPGRWWLDTRVDIERHHFKTNEGIDKFSRKSTKNENSAIRKGLLSETDLRSLYKVTIEPPANGDFWQRYLTSALITIEERSTGKLVAKVREPAWGGGLVGSYISALTNNNPFSHINRYLSCGYAGQEIGIFRGQSNSRRELYQSADQNLTDQFFIVNSLE
jgi:hypothetical protein